MKKLQHSCKTKMSILDYGENLPQKKLLMALKLKYKLQQTKTWNKESNNNYIFDNEWICDCSQRDCIILMMNIQRYEWDEPT